MSTIEKLYERIMERPIRKDITLSEIVRLAGRYDSLTVIPGGKHQTKIVHCDSGTIIPIPCHGSAVGCAYVEQFQNLLYQIESE